MKKVLLILLDEFRKLGANIIFANFYKVIIDTGKFDISAAKAYCDSFLNTLQKRFVFDSFFKIPPNEIVIAFIFLVVISCH